MDSVGKRTICIFIYDKRYGKYEAERDYGSRVRRSGRARLATSFSTVFVPRLVRMSLSEPEIDVNCR